jgi:hypothetical protein
MRSEPFLWIHLAGIAVVPLSLQLVWLGLAIGTPLPFFWLELLAIALIGIVPVFLMQWNRPFDIFSLMLVSIKPEHLSEARRRILSLFARKSQQLLALIAAIVMLVLLWQIYRLAPLAAIAATPIPQYRLLGLVIAIVGFWLSNLFFQVPVSVLGVLLVGKQQFASTEPWPVENIAKKFTIPGFRVNKIPFLPPEPTIQTQ